MLNDLSEDLLDELQVRPLLEIYKINIYLHLQKPQVCVQFMHVECVFTQRPHVGAGVDRSKSVKCPAASVSTYTGTLQTAHRGRKATEMYLAMSWTALSASPTHTVYVCQYKPFQQIFPNAVCCEH